MKRVIILLFVLPLMVFAQEKGISFEHHTTWEKVKAKAKAENKHIFVDCFTTWCGPCKWMSENVFPTPEAGEFFNANFVNLKIQMDETESDSPDVKSWYEEAKRFANDYGVAAYPTFLVFDPNGELVHRVVGGGEVQDFIASIGKGLDPETQYITIQKAFKANPTDGVLAKKFAAVALEAYDEASAAEAFEAFIKHSTADEVIQAENIELLTKSLSSTTSPAYTFVVANSVKLDKLFKEAETGYTSNDLLAEAILTEEVYPKLQSEDGNVDLAAMTAELTKKYPKVNLTKQINQLKIQVALYKQDWKTLIPLLNKQIKDQVEFNPGQLNEIAWSMFETSKDKVELEQALSWSKISVDLAPHESAYLDTYANLLYKTGDKVNAILWQQKALEAASDEDKANYQSTLDKMKAGTPTWE